MIRLLHVVPCLGIGGLEQLVLDLCRFGDSSTFECAVAAPEEGPIADEFRRAGFPVTVGRAALESVASADLVNLHSLGYDPVWHGVVLASASPYVITLHWPAVMPRLAAPLICTSKHLFDMQPDRTTAVSIPNGIDVERFRCAPRPEREHVVITQVCRSGKSALYFWEAIQYTLDRFPNARLRIVGNPPGLGRSRDRVEFLGIRRDIPTVLAESDIFGYAPFPEYGSCDLVVLEASAAGLPCVVSDVPSVNASIVEGETGFLTPFGDVTSFAERIGRLVADAGLRKKMGSAAASFAALHFDIRGVQKQYEEVYRQVLASTVAGPSGDLTPKGLVS